MNFIHNIPEYKVSQFNRLFKELVEVNFDYVKIKGEISELKQASSGHLYLTLKDETSVLNATIWKQKKDNLRIKPEIGMEVIVSGKISTYAKSISTYSINIDNLELAGEGALLRLIDERKKKLKQQGLFEDTHKKKIPYLSKKIGVITSITGSVVHDIINRIKDRFPTNIDIWPVSVQGVHAADSIIEAIKGFNSKGYTDKPEIIIIARGGGSIEDLMPFNDEQLALAVYNSNIPIISAIGHETDTTIIDYVSDLRASTPTAAAEKSVPMRNELEQLVIKISQRLNYYSKNKYSNSYSKFLNLSKFLKAPNLIINSYKERFCLVEKNLFQKLNKTYNDNNLRFNTTNYLLKSPETKINDSKKSLINYTKEINQYIDNITISQNKELVKYTRLLESNSIHSNLKKGYSIIKKANKIINLSNLINKDDELKVNFFDKQINLKIKKIN